MSAVLGILFGAGLTVLVCLALGKIALRALHARLYRQEDNVIAFVTGAACLSLVVFVLAAARAATVDAFLIVAAVAIARAERLRGQRPLEWQAPTAGRGLRVLFWILFAAFTYHYLCNALAPETSPAGTQYHLGLVTRYLRWHGFDPIATAMFGSLPQGVEMLFLFAATFGRPAAAPMVHFSFLLALPLAMLCYGRRFGFPAAAAAAALLVYASPIAGYNGASACVDVAAATAVFCLFYVLQIWDEERAPGLLVVAGLLAGFACAIKYTAFPAIPYALAYVGWKILRKRDNPLRPVAIVAVFAVLMAGPWLVKKLAAPDASGVAVNRLQRAQSVEALDLPLDATIRGAKLQGLTGPIFLLAPIGLLALRFRAGRHLLLAAAVFAVAYPLDPGTRFLVAVLPFTALAMSLVFAKWKGVTPAVLAIHAITAWPACARLYCDRGAPRLERSPLKAALRIQPEEEHLPWLVPRYRVARMLDEKVPAAARVFAYGALPLAYTSRIVLSGRVGDTLVDATLPASQPAVRKTFRFPAQAVRRLRIVQTSESTGEWSVSELRVFLEGRELPREPQWRVRASPNPREAQAAFDNNPLTRWRSRRDMRAGDHVEIDLGSAERADAVVLDTPADRSRLALEFRTQNGTWVRVAESPEISAVAPERHARWMASRELRWQGFEYVLIADEDAIAKDVRRNMIDWGFMLIDERPGARLYRVE